MRVLRNISLTVPDGKLVVITGPNGGGMGIRSIDPVNTTDLVSRSVARGNSHQFYRSRIVGNTPCTGHSECDAILADHGRVDAAPELSANHGDAVFIHEAAIGKITGEQILKLRTLGMTEHKAEEKLWKDF